MKEELLIAKRIEEICREKKISYYTLAFQSTVPITTIMNIMHGHTKNPRIYTLFKLCDGMGVTIQEFFDHDLFADIEAMA